MPGSHDGLAAQWVPLAHHGGPPKVPGSGLVPGGFAQHLLSAGAVPLHSPPLAEAVFLATKAVEARQGNDSVNAKAVS